jgi:hypothetical protein
MQPPLPPMIPMRDVTELVTYPGWMRNPGALIGFVDEFGPLRESEVPSRAPCRPDSRTPDPGGPFPGDARGGCPSCLEAETRSGQEWMQRVLRHGRAYRRNVTDRLQRGDTI